MADLALRCCSATVLEFRSVKLLLFGASIALTGALQLLGGNPTVGRYETRESPEDRPNFLFSGGVNSFAGRINASASSSKSRGHLSTSLNSRTSGMRSWNCPANALGAMVTTV